MQKNQIVDSPIVTDGARVTNGYRKHPQAMQSYSAGNLKSAI
jgi:hypothetical protein